MRHKIFKILVLTLILSPVPALAQQSHNGKVYCSIMRWATLTFPGVVHEILVSPGDTVTAGQTLLTYSLSEQVARELQSELDTGPQVRELQMHLLEVKRQLLELDDQRETASRLSEAKLGSKHAMSRLNSSRELLLEQRRLLTDSIARLQGVYQARIRELESRFGVALANGKIPDRLLLTSEVDGQVLQLDMWLRPGMAFGPMQNAVAVGVMDPVRIRAHVFEAEVVNLAVGDTARVVVSSLGDRELNATVTQIERSPVDIGLDRPSYYGVELQAANPDQSLRQGFKANIFFNHPPSQPANQ